MNVVECSSVTLSIAFEYMVHVKSMCTKGILLHKKHLRAGLTLRVLH